MMKKLLPILLASSLLSGCAVATAGIKKGDERNFVRSINDVSAGRVIEARMNRALDYNLKGIDVEVAEGIVLLSGNVPTQKDRIEAARIAWSAPRIEEVGNEIMIKSKQGIIRNAKDGILEKSVRTRMAADKLVKARNFNVETHDGIVYLMGVARTQLELERAATIAATTRGTKEVISYARLADLPAAERARLTQEAQSYLAPPTPPRELPDFLTTQPMAGGTVAPTPSPTAPSPTAPSQTYTAPSAPTYTAPDMQAAAPVRAAPLSEPIPFVPQAPVASVGLIEGPTAPAELDMGDKLNKEFPTDEELGAYRTGEAGEAVSIIESAPYYVDPETGKEIPVRFDANGNMIPLVIR
ncbi:BON domain-containing protein [Litorimonas sp. RW-G-Af-16]|uniref:BON domain-containing protein n=1 Tax=Litorimonas sp. RW-G-Af-16 TaxID=3241168 RepID=UPI00390C649F